MAGAVAGRCGGGAAVVAAAVRCGGGYEGVAAAAVLSA